MEGNFHGGLHSIHQGLKGEADLSLCNWGSFHRQDRNLKIDIHLGEKEDDQVKAGTETVQLSIMTKVHKRGRC